MAGLAVACMLALGVVACMPAAAHAQTSAGGLQAADSGTVLTTQATKYTVWVGGQQVTSANKNNVLGNGTVKYNPKTNTLTLKNAKIKGVHACTASSGGVYLASIYSCSDKGLTIVLKGKNTVTSIGEADVGNYGLQSSNSADSATADLWIKGSGSLKVAGGKAGLYSVGIVCRNLNIEGSAKVTAKGGSLVKTSRRGTDESGSFGTYTTGTFTLRGSAKLTATGKKRAMRVAPTFASGYTPQVKAGASAKSIKVNKKKPAAGVYTSYKYVSITKAQTTSVGKKPAKVTITKVAPLGSGFTLYFNPVKKNCTGYQLELTHVASGKTWSFKTGNAATNSATLRDLAGGASYTVRIRGFNETSSKTYYGAWSAKKSVTTYNGTPAG